MRNQEHRFVVLYGCDARPHVCWNGRSVSLRTEVHRTLSAAYEARNHLAGCSPLQSARQLERFLDPPSF